jgi:diaminopimelate epimerase
MRFYKYQGLGNDYLVQDDPRIPLSPLQIRQICDRHYGLGSDGILAGPFMPFTEDFRQIGEAAGLSPEQNNLRFYELRILNPDGSEAEKSGNGLRIFTRYLYDRGLVGHNSFLLSTLGGQVKARFQSPEAIQVDMGKVSFNSQDLSLPGTAREVVGESWTVNGQTLTLTAATIGNPHCIILCTNGEDLKAMALQMGPALEVHPAFPARTNVQFLRPVNRHAIDIEIWERGAGYTLASGSSASACAAAAIRLGLCDSPVEVRMPGGILQLEADAAFHMRQCGPAGFIGTMDFTPDETAGGVR